METMGNRFTRFRLWVTSKIILRKASAAQRMAWKWKHDAILALRKLDRSVKTLQVAKKEAEVEGVILLDRYETVQTRVQSVAEEALTELEDAQAVIERYDSTEAALSSELEVIKEVTLKDLMLHREVTRQHLKADIAVLSRHMPSSSEEE